MADNQAVLLFVPSLLFALAYFPALAKLSKGLVSPYAKADVRRRFAAAGVDGLLVMTLLGLSATQHNAALLVAALAYLLLRDAFWGQSIGKFLFSLVVIKVTTGQLCTPASSAYRNFFLVVPGANVVAVFLEASSIARDPQGQRLGDRLAQTQVVEGLGAKELVKSLKTGALPRTPARSLAGPGTPRSAPSQARRARLGPLYGADHEKRILVRRRIAVQQRFSRSLLAEIRSRKTGRRPAEIDLKAPGSS